VYELPSDPEIEAWVAFVTVTVKVDELPGVIVGESAVMATRGFAGDATVRSTVVYSAPPQ
jgi:hypothetical protein